MEPEIIKEDERKVVPTCWQRKLPHLLSVCYFLSAERLETLSMIAWQTLSLWSFPHCLQGSVANPISPIIATCQPTK